MNRADIEFFESRLVLKVAHSLLPAGTAWENLSHRSKQRYLDRAVTVVGALLDDRASMDRLHWLRAKAVYPKGERQDAGVP